jgi:REP element-mobilizing transposase RayT
MTRPLRVEFTGALYHITSRGDRREAIFEDDEDRERFLGVLAEVVSRYNWLCRSIGTRISSRIRGMSS